MSVMNAPIQIIGTNECSILRFLFPVGRKIIKVVVDGKYYVPPKKLCVATEFDNLGSRLQDKYLYLSCGHEVNAWEPNDVDFCPKCGREIDWEHSVLSYLEE